MPCMNLMSAPVYWTCERSLAFWALMIWLACPGAPGCTIGGDWSVRGAGAAGDDAALPCDAVLHDAPMQASTNAGIRADLGVKTP